MRNMKIFFSMLVFLFSGNNLYAQVYTTPQNISGIINTYTKVTAATGTSITVASSTGFTAGNKAIIIQMQGAGINSSDTKVPTWGSINSINDAGNYEVVNITSVVGNTIAISPALSRTYTPAGNVQLITYPQYNGGATVTATITAPAWNGNTGGVVAMEACGTTGTITLNANIDVTDKGFRAGSTAGKGGGCYSNRYAYDNGATVIDTTWAIGTVYITCATASPVSGPNATWTSVCGSAWRSNFGGGCGCFLNVPSCNNLVFFDSLTYKNGQNISCTGLTGAFSTNSYTPNGGEKGEGIALPIASLRFGRGAIANGGGGGNEHNGGGGGGSNFGAGGYGGMDLSQCFVGLPANQKDSAARGLGGFALNTYYAQNKIFMGGGGGSAAQNDNQFTLGTPGGGIVILSATTLVNNGFSILANASDNDRLAQDGNVGANADGAGGAGAGGVVLLNVNTFTNALTVQAKGGRGAHNYYSSLSECYAPGGGGGGGAVWFKSATTPAGITVNVSGGGAGNEMVLGSPSPRTCNLNDPRYGARAGANGGISYGLNLPSSCITAPLKWISVSATVHDGFVSVEWTVTDVKNVLNFVVQRSADGIYWENIATVNNPTNSKMLNAYGVDDYNYTPDHTNYYRIKQVDINLKSTYSQVCSAHFYQNKVSYQIYPNPVLKGKENEFYIKGTSGNVSVAVFDASGRNVHTSELLLEDEKAVAIRLGIDASGVYFVRLTSSEGTEVKMLVVR